MIISKLEKPKIIFQDNYGDVLTNVQKHVEYCGRTCYNSRDKITDDSHVSFYNNIVDKKHLSVLEHAEVCVIYNNNLHYTVETMFNMQNKLLGIMCPFRIKKLTDGRYLIITNARYYLEFLNPDDTNFRQCILPESLLDYDFRYIYIPNSRITMEMKIPIAITREFNRHRCLSISEMSTRYINLSKKGMCDYYLDFELKTDNDNDMLNKYIKSIYSVYEYLIENGIPNQKARGILPLNTISQINYTGFMDQWKDIILKRSVGAHPIAKQIVEDIKNLIW